MEKQVLRLDDQWLLPGEHPFFFSGIVGPMEAVLSVPNVVNHSYIALLGHPHSLQGGTMNNKVVTTLARVFKELGIPSIRFNFRGVGLSSGVYDEGIGESQDMGALAALVLKQKPTAQLIWAGFSFGSYVVYRAAAEMQQALLISIAPPVHHYDFTEFLPHEGPWIIAQGDVDEVVSSQFVLDFIQQLNPPPLLLRFADTGHFFHGKLIELKDRMMEAVRMQLNLL